MSTALFLLSIWCYVLLSIFVPCAWNAFLTLSTYVCFDIGVAWMVRDLFIYLCGNTTVLSWMGRQYIVWMGISDGIVSEGFLGTLEARGV